VTYYFWCLQNIPSKWVTGKIVFLKGLWVLMGKAPVATGAFFKSSSIVADWVELVRQLYLVYFHRVRWFGGLTRKTGSGKAGKGKKTAFGFGGGMGGEAGFSAARLTIRL
jgi:hypothetical protein